MMPSLVWEILFSSLANEFVLGVGECGIVWKKLSTLTMMVFTNNKTNLKTLNFAKTKNQRSFELKEEDPK